MFVQDVMAAMSTEPCCRVNSCPSNRKGTVVFILSWGMANPLNPMGETRHFWKSSFISETDTLEEKKSV